MAIKHSKVEDVVRHLGDLEAVFILLPSTNEGGTADLGQADLGNGLAIANAGRQQDGLVDPIVPDAERIPRGGTAAAVGIKPSVAVATLRRTVDCSPKNCPAWVAAGQERSDGCLSQTSGTDMRTTAPEQVHQSGC